MRQSKERCNINLIKIMKYIEYQNFRTEKLSDKRKSESFSVRKFSFLMYTTGTFLRWRIECLNNKDFFA